jgi:hypothetical protein
MGDGKVAVLNVVPVDRTGAPQKIVIEFVEGVLARARTGEIQSIVVAYAHANGWAGHGNSCGERRGDCFAVGTALLLAEHEFACQMEESTVDAPPPPPEEPA